MAVDLREHVLVAAVLRVSLDGAADLVLGLDDPRLQSLADALIDGDSLDEAAFAPHAERALAALAAVAPTDARIARLLGVWRPWLERRIAGSTSPAGGEAALAARFEARLAAIVAAMELAREEGDDDRAEALHARYIELGTSYAMRLHRP
jgi:hypothetical protein